jgi:hypothetical protein
MFHEVLVSISFMCIRALLILTSIDYIVLAFHSLAFWGLVPLEAIQTGLIVIAIQAVNEAGGALHDLAWSIQTRLCFLWWFMERCS